MTRMAERVLANLERTLSGWGGNLGGQKEVKTAYGPDAAQVNLDAQRKVAANMNTSLGDVVPMMPSESGMSADEVLAKSLGIKKD